MDRYSFFGGSRGGCGRMFQQEIIEVAEGNPGCLQFICELVELPGGWEAIMVLKEFGIHGSRAYQLWNDCCGRDTKAAAEILMLAKEGKITQEEIYEHIDQPWGTPFDTEEIRKREKQPATMFRKIRVEIDHRLRGVPGGEKMQMDRFYRILMEGMFLDSSDLGKTFTVRVDEKLGADGCIYLEARKEEVKNEGYETVQGNFTHK